LCHLAQAQKGEHHGEDSLRDTLVLLGKNSVVGEMEFVQFVNPSQSLPVAATVTATTEVKAREVTLPSPKSLI
jgi:hypothetical protein